MYIIKVEISPTDWLPAIVQFQTDNSPKGFAVFTTMDAANAFRAQMDGASSLMTEIVRLGTQTEGMEVSAREFVSRLVAWAQNDYAFVMNKTPVYIDPPTLYCKDIRNPCKNLELFFMRYMQRDYPWDHEPICFHQEKRHTVMILQSKIDEQFAAVVVKGNFIDRASMSEAIQGLAGTTERAQHACLLPFRQADEALAAAVAAINNM